MRLNLGCGSDLLPGYVNVDRELGPGVNRVWDLDRYPWPWRDASAQEVVAGHVIEHVEDPVRFVREAVLR